MSDYNGVERRAQVLICEEKFKRIDEFMAEVKPLIRETRECVFNGLTSSMQLMKRIVVGTAIAISVYLIQDIIRSLF